MYKSQLSRYFYFSLDQTWILVHVVAEYPLNGFCCVFASDVELSKVGHVEEVGFGSGIDTLLSDLGRTKRR